MEQKEKAKEEEKEKTEEDEKDEKEAISARGCPRDLWLKRQQRTVSLAQLDPRQSFVTQKCRKLHKFLCETRLALSLSFEQLDKKRNSSFRRNKGPVSRIFVISLKANSIGKLYSPRKIGLWHRVIRFCETGNEIFVTELSSSSTSIRSTLSSFLINDCAMEALEALARNFSINFSVSSIFLA